MNREEKAAFFEIGLRAGVVNPTDVIEWADAEIISDPRPTESLIDLSTCPLDTPHRMHEKLRLLSGKVNGFTALRLLAPTLIEGIEAGRLDAETIASFIWGHLVASGLDQMPAEFWPLYASEDEFYLAVAQAYGTRETATNDLLSAMRKVAL